MDLLKFFGKLLGWLSGVLAGTTAVLYGLGFIATVAHLGMLGLDWAITAREPLWYLGLGAQVAAHWALQAMLALLLVLGIGEILRWFGRRARRGDPEAPSRLARVVNWIDRRLVWFISVISLVLIGYMMSAFEGALEVRNLLFAENELLCRRDGVVGDLAAADLRALSARAERVVFFAALALGLAGYAAPRLASGRGGPVPLLVCLAVGLQALGAVPAAHGLFILDQELRAVSAEGEHIGAFSSGQLYMLARAENGLWAWEPPSRRVHWFAEGSFGHLEIGKAHSMRALACR